MATFTGDALKAVERARMAGSLLERVMALEDAVALLVQELQMVLTTLGPENFSEMALQRIREE